MLKRRKEGGQEGGEVKQKKQLQLQLLWVLLSMVDRYGRRSSVSLLCITPRFAVQKQQYIVNQMHMLATGKQTVLSPNRWPQSTCRARVCAQHTCATQVHPLSRSPPQQATKEAATLQRKHRTITSPATVIL